MRATTYREQLKRMQNHVYCLQSRAKQLQREQDSVQQQLDVLEGLMYARDAWAGVIKSVLQSNEEDGLLLWTQPSLDPELQQQLNEHQHDPERIKQQMPLLPALSCFDKRMHASVMKMTSADAAKQIVAYLGDVTQLLVLYELDPVLATPLLTAHCTHILAWLLGFWFFNMHVACELHHVNLFTLEKEAPPEGHWQNAYDTLGLSQEQQEQIAIASRFVLPRLKDLQQQQAALLQELADLQQSVGPVGLELLPETPTYPAGGPGFALVKEAAAVAAAAAAAATPAGTRPEESVHAAAAPVIAPESSTRTDAATAVNKPDGTDSGYSSNRARQHRMAKANELMQKISANCHAWRVVTSMRAHYSAAVLTPLQLAKVLTAVAPYLLVGAPICDVAVASTPAAQSTKRTR